MSAQSFNDRMEEGFLMSEVPEAAAGKDAPYPLFQGAYTPSRRKAVSPLGGGGGCEIKVVSSIKKTPRRSAAKVKPGCIPGDNDRNCLLNLSPLIIFKKKYK